MSGSILHEPYHDLHHRYPKLPYENLPAAAQVDPVRAEPVPLFAGYWGAWKDLLKGLPDPKFGPAWRERAKEVANLPASG